MDRVEPRRGEWRDLVIRYAPAVSVALPFVALVVQLLVLRPEVHLFGDDALIELAVLDAVAGDQASGVYSRLGFHHPGPTFFYLMAPVSLLTGAASWALFVGVQLFQMIAAVTVVEAVRRRFGTGVAAVSSALVMVQLIGLGPDVVLSPWNPLVVLLPLALFLVLVGTATQFGPRWCAAVFVGTVVVQTNIGTLPIVAATGALGTVLVLLRRRGAEPVRRTRAATVVCVALLGATALAWMHPVVDVVLHGGDSNAAAIVDSLRHGSEQFGDGPSVLDSTQIVGRELATVGVGVAYGSRLERVIDPATFGLIGPWVLVVGAVAAAAVVMWVGRRRASPALLQLGAVCVLAVPVAVLAVSRVIGGLHWYVVIWSVAIVVPLLVGVAAAAWATWSLERSQVALALSSAAAPLAAVAATVVLLTGSSWTAPTIPGTEPGQRDWGRNAVAQAWSAVEPEVDGAESVHISGGDGIWWGLAAGLAVHLEQEGIDVTVDDFFLDKFGPDRRSGGGEDVRLLIATRGTTEAPPGAELLTTISGVPVYRVP